jgi:hypothetical protein
VRLYLWFLLDWRLILSTFLQILGAAVLISAVLLVLVIGIGYFWLRSRFKKLARTIEASVDSSGEAQGQTWNATPTRIHLRRLEKYDWKDARKVENAVRAFNEAGFTEVGIFAVQEIPFHVYSFVHPAEGLRGVVYEHPMIGVCADAIFVADDGTTVTVANAPTGNNLDHLPGHDKVYLPPETPVEDLIARARQEDRGKAPGRVSVESWQQDFEDIYAEEMDWRNGRGGVTKTEIHRIAAHGGHVLSEDDLDDFREKTRQQANADLETVLREHYFARCALSQEQREAQQDLLVFIHDNLSLEEAASFMRMYLNEEEAELIWVADLHPDIVTARQAFEAWNERLNPGDKFERVAGLNHPLPTDVYLAPSYD